MGVNFAKLDDESISIDFLKNFKAHLLLKVE